MYSTVVCTGTVGLAYICTVGYKCTVKRIFYNFFYSSVSDPQIARAPVGRVKK